MMNINNCMKLLILLYVTLSYSQDKDLYIKQNLPELFLNLNTSEINTFKEVMEFDERGNLSSWDMVLLEKGTKEKFNSAISTIVSKLTGRNDGSIVLIDSDNNERILPAKSTVVTLDGKKYDLDDIKKSDGLFVILSTTCGSCFKSFEVLNKISTKYKNLNFYGLFTSSFENIKNYKKGYAYKNFGFLNNDWIIFSSDVLIKELDNLYDSSSEGYPVVIIRKDGEIKKKIYQVDFNTIEKEIINFKL